MVKRYSNNPFPYFNMASAEKSNHQETVVDGGHEEKDQNQTAEQTEPEPTEDEKRLRTLTKKSEELYENEVQKYSAKIDKIWNDIENIPSEIENTGTDIKALRALASNLDDMGKRYERENKMLLEYLTRTNASESQQELDSQKAIFDKGKDIIQKLRKRIQDSCMEITDSVSQRSQETTSPSVSSILFKKRMEADIQHANVQFREKELAILKQKASLREIEAKRQAESERKKAELVATHHFLEEERKAAVAEAEVRALQNFDSENKQRSIIPKHIDTPVNRNQYTARFSNDHSDDKFDMDPFSTCESESVFTHSNHEKSNNKETPTVQKCILKELLSQNVKSPESPTVVSDLTIFLLMKDLLFSRFSHFNDKPETFTTWKTSFKGITEE